MKAHRDVIAWMKACGATLLLVSPLAAERLIVRTYSVVDGLPSDRIVCLVTDRDGFLWVCTSGGLSRFDGSRFVTYGTAHGLPDPVVNHFLQARSGSRWVAMNGGGVARLEPGAPGADGRIFEPFDVGSTARSMRVNILFETRDGSLLAGTDGGLFRARHPDATPRFELVPLALPGFPDSGLNVWAIAEDREGRFWVGTSGGLVHLRGTRSPQHIPVALAPNVDDDWGTAKSQSSVLYGGLGPGRYRFQVRAGGATGRVSAEPATVDFTILPPFWLRAWFLAGLTALLAAALFAAHRLRVQRVLELERVRTRIAADLHDDLGASLARVSLLSEATRRTLPDSPERAERMLHEIGTTSRELVTAAGDIAFSIDPGRGRLDGLVARLRRFTEDLLADTDIDWRFTVNGEMTGVVLSSDQRRHLLAILKEALHNSVRHAQPRHVSLTLALQEDVLEAELADDGCGFRTNVSGNGRGPQTGRNGRGRQTTGGNGREPEAGHGLRNMRDRAGELGAHIEITSHPGGGTRISLRCPLRSRPRMIMR